MTEIRARIHTTDGLEYTTTMDSSDIDHLTTEEQTAVLTKLARELHGQGLNVANLSVDRIEIVETSWTPWSSDTRATPNPSMFNGVARLFAPAGAAGSVPPTAVVPPVAAPLPMSPAFEAGVTESADGGRFTAHALTPVNQERDGDRVYDVYTTPGPNGGTERWRRPHEGTPRNWEVNRGGAWAPATRLVSPAIADIVRRTPPGWEVRAEGDTTIFTETAGAHRRIRVGNAFDGIVEVGTENPADHTFTYRAATSADALPNFPHLPMPGGTGSVRDGSNTVAVVSADGPQRFVTEGEGPARVRWELMVAPGATPGTPPTALYRRRVDEFGRPLDPPRWQKFHPNAGGTGGTFRNVGAAGGGTAVRPHPPARAAIRLN